MLQWIDKNRERFSGELLFDEPLSRHTYWRIGGPARVLAVPKNQQDLAWIFQAATECALPVFILGMGSNILVSDQGFDGMILKASRVNSDISFINGIVRTGAGVAVSTLLRKAAQEGWSGLEFLSGVPGSVGGVVAMNAGTHLGEAKDRLVKVEAFAKSGSIQSFTGPELRFEYRKNLFLPEGSVVWAAEWRIDPGEPAKVKAVIDDTLRRRKNTQPLDYPSCGSVFKNPKASGLHAWQVIDRLGLRGHRAGDAQFSEKHSNFIINLNQATAADVRSLIDLAKRRAQDELSIQLEEEVITLSSKG